MLSFVLKRSDRMLKVVLTTFLLVADSSTLDGSWQLDFKTVGKRVKLELVLQSDGKKVVAKCGEVSFKVLWEDQDLSWELGVPVMNGIRLATFKGSFVDENKLSGILVISEAPYAGRAVKWTARRITHPKFKNNLP